jgi:hypothetical protein
VTLLVTFYSARGIIFAADSAITITTDHKRGAERVRHEEKFLRAKQLGKTGGVVGYFGLAQVGDESMSDWLRRTIDRWPGSPCVADFGDYLRDELNGAVPKAHRENYPSGFHIGAFESRQDKAVPILQYVTNIQSLDEQTGAYSGFVEYSSGEHFPKHPSGNGPCQTVDPSHMERALRSWEREHGLPVWFRNGELAFCWRPWHGLTWAIGDITHNLPKFRVPDDLRKWELLADTLVRTNAQLYALLIKRGDPTIEPPVRSTSIPWPE